MCSDGGPPNTPRAVLPLFWIALLLLASCSSIPMSTLTQLGRLNERDLLSLDANVLRVKVSLPVAYPLDAENCELSLQVVSAGRPYRGTFHLEIEDTRSRSVSEGLFARSQPATEYVLRLTADSRLALRELQQSVHPSETSDVALDVRVALKSAPEGVMSTKVWVDVMLKKEQGYFALVDGGTLPLDGNEIHRRSR